VIRTIGIVGGGQLGRMFTLAAKSMGFDVITLDPQERSPAGQVADDQIVAAFDDLTAIDELGKRADVVTYEFENIDARAIEHLERSGYHVMPSSNVLRTTQDRLLEKRFVRECGIPTADFAEVATAADLDAAAASVGLPAILKTVRGGYDGKGQWRVETIDEARAAVAEARGALLIYERVVPFACELSVVATCAADGTVISYPVTQNEHDRGVLAVSIAPARVSQIVHERAHMIATAIGRGLGIVGTYCVELFALDDGTVLVNEIAPRPHNSGHYTIDATQCSQFEQHVRAVCRLPLSQPRMLSNAIMVNILGTGTGDQLTGESELLADPSIVLHMYGKRRAIDRRKMGHFTMLIDGPIDEHAIHRAREAYAKLGWA
jgi:5-(carboxyamino)imidazole ribonucleotide synthase